MERSEPKRKWSFHECPSSWESEVTTRRLVSSRSLHVLSMDNRNSRCKPISFTFQLITCLLTTSPFQSYAPIVLSVFTIVCIGIALVALSLRFIVLARRAWNYGSLTPPASSDTIEAGPHAELHSSPFKAAPENSFTTPNPGKALPKAQRREVEDLAVGELLVVGGASYAPFWNAYKCRSRRTTAGRRSQWKGRGWWFGIIELVLVPFVTALFVAFAHVSSPSSLMIDP